MTLLLPPTRRSLMMTRLLFLIMLITFIPVYSSAAKPQIMVVLDASGSMWGQIDGVSKIAIARKTLDTVLNEVPAGVRLGLMAYGHREKGKCEDIETLVQPAPGTADQIRQTVAKIHPKGMTPLTQSVRNAAQSLNFVEEKATVILITDGLETCKADPCSLAQELEKTGIDFTTHVVGFELNEDEGKQVACLSEETGGIYVSAGNALELNEALTVTVKDDAPAAPAPPAQLPKAALHADDTVKSATPFTVTWEGPGDRFDSIQLSDPTALDGAGKVIRSRQVIQGDYAAKQVTFTAPSLAGRYQLRYYDVRTRAVLAARKITVEGVGSSSTASDASSSGETIKKADGTKGEVSLSAPDQIHIGETIKIEWVGPGERNHWIQLFDPQADDGDGKVVRKQSLTSGDYDKRRVKLAAPGKEGLYHLRYWDRNNGVVLGTREITVTKGEVSLSAPDQIHIGETIKIEWVGPGERNHWIQLFDPQADDGDGKVVRKQSLTSGDYDKRRVKLAAPGKEGLYHLHYWDQNNQVVLGTREITVTKGEVSLSAPDQIHIGETIKIEWVGPGERNHWIQLFDPQADDGDGKVVRKQSLTSGDYDKRRVKLDAPDREGLFHLRYWDNDNKVVLTAQEITVVK